MKRRLRDWRTWAILFALLLFIWLAVSFTIAYRLTRRAQPISPELPPVIGWGSIESLRLTARDGQSLGAWYIDGSSAGASIVLLHGNGGSRSVEIDIAELLVKAGHSVLMVTQRAHGDSSGTINDCGLSARLDVIVAVGECERRRPGVPIILFGRSLGSAAAIFAAQELGGRVQGYLLECPYRDLATAVSNRTENNLPPGLAYIAYAGLWISASIVLPDFPRISPFLAIRQIPESVNVLILAGRNDTRARPSEALALRNQIPTHCELLIFAKAGHLALRISDPAQYNGAVLNFITDSLARR